MFTVYALVRVWQYCPHQYTGSVALTFTEGLHTQCHTCSILLW